MVVFAFSDSQQEFARVVRTFALEELAPKYAHWDPTGELPLEQWQKMGQLGITGICIPEAYGGQEADCVTTGIAAEEVARGEFNCGDALIENCLNGEILGHACDRIKAAWLPGMACGEHIVAIAVTETRGGSDAAGMEARARRHGDE
jgi:cyclohexanecarboxyl-CoA dehydrogenase